MFGFKRLLRMLAPLAVVCGALFVASCGGNSTPSATVTNPPSQGYSVTLTTGSGAVQLPLVTNNEGVTLQYQGSNVTLPSPFPTSGVTLVTTTAVTAPTNAPLPTSLKRTPLSKTNATVVLYLTFNVSSSLPANIFSSETLALGTVLPTNVPYFVELDDLTNTANPYINTYPGGAISNSSVTFANANGFIPSLDLSTKTFNSTDTYLLQFYYLGTGATPTPTPSPNASASPSPTPTPVGVSTTVPFGTAESIGLPVTLGGFVGTVNVPAAGSSAIALTATAQSSLPSGITAVGTANNTVPFYSLGLSSSAAVAAGSPGIQLQLPSNFSTTNQILAALCTLAAPCPIETQQPTLSTSGTTGVLTLNPGQFQTFAGYSTTPQYVIFYSNRSTPVSNTVTGTVPAGSTTTLTVPTITTSSGASYSSAVTLGGLSATTSATVAAQTGLFSGISAIIPNTQTVFYALDITASPAVTTTGNALACGSSPCIALSVAPQTVTAAATAKASFYVEQCSATACPAPLTTPQALPLGGNNTLNVSSAQVGAVPGLGSTPFYLVFYYQ